MKKTIIFNAILTILFAACSTLSEKTASAISPIGADEKTSTTPANTETPPPTQAVPTETLTSIPPTETNTPTSIPFVESLKASVTAELLSCRYGPGAEYLYLYGLRQGANIELIGRADGNNWVMVAGKSLCWVNAKFLDIQGDSQMLKVMYPDGYKLPVSPYYRPTTVLSAMRDGNSVTVKWSEIALVRGDEEDANMFIYIIEVWRCEGGRTIFDPLASNYAEITFVDEAGCNAPSHGRIFFQEKHGFAGPAEIPWPPIVK